jgi:M6 family metalloprotease-like protein
MMLTRFATALLAALSLTLFDTPTVLAHGQGEALLAQIEPGADASAETASGVVHVLTIDNPLRGTSSRHVDLQLDDGTLLPLRGDGTVGLHTGARVTVSGRHDGRWLDVASAQEVAGASSAGGTKSDTQIDGSFAILHADDFAGGKSSFIYQLRQASGKVSRLRLGASPPGLAPGMHVRVAGHAEADGVSITPDHITVLAEPTASTETGIVSKAATADSVLVIMANFSNTVAPAFTSAQAQQVMTSNPDSVANFFREASYGQQVMNVTVTPSWVTMNLPQPASCGDSDWQMIGASAEAAAKAQGATYDPASYDFVVYVFPAVPACGWLGLAYIGSPHKAWINGTSSFRTAAITHEMGHNFGLLHAASLRCGSNAIGGSCTVSEYGDPFDTMGNQRAMHYNAMQKSKLAWIASTSVATHAGGSATYTLSPLEVGGGGTYAIRIPTASSKRTYWIEFRQPIGFDSPLSAFPNNGAQIRVSSPFETLCAGCDSYSDDTELVDTTPATSDFTDATLVAGQSFSDATFGINVTVLAASASALTVQVATGGGTSQAKTTTSLSSSMNPAPAGTAITFTAVVAGASPTGTVTFSVGSCGAVSLTGTGNARSANCVVTGLGAGTYSITASYGGDAANVASSATLAQTVTDATVTSRVPVYRFNTGTYHFYTASESEKNALLASMPGWTLEGIAFYADAGSVAQDLPVYRFNTGTYHFYTISEAEKNYILANIPGFVLEGVAFYASAVSGAQLLPVYRFNARTYHFYTISEAEKNYIIENIPGYTLEGIAFYARGSP